ncbi:1,3-beta-glucanosyltransferase [Lachnellula occidentalis]|uniref:1,3-beta-glucanosyltransferase n=1 Tax=Lachnellula occidentalis TaxID=215460 RepID=A0A8H8RK04_9HELO|nr:1,3-beta-glucanosyltransferase [Lachnellula occidentalis]
MFANMLVKSALLASFAISATNAIATITTLGNKFFDSDGNQFFMKGVAYQLTEKDPLINTDQCQLDASLMKDLGANTIRVYHVDASGDHDGCMSAFSDAGVYLLVDLDTFNTAINPIVASWNQTQFDRYSAVMDAFANYDNTMGFFVGNEVVALNNQSLAAPYVKAAARDLKAYRNSKNYREIPVGYSAADISELRPMLQNYLACGTNASESIDMFGLNAYEWCGDVNMQTSGYDTLNTYAKSLNIPIFFSETGCNTNRPRTFDDQSAILGPDMNENWSGAIVYEWIQEANSYGLISYGSTVAATAVATNVQGGYSIAGTPTPVSPDFSNLQAQWKTLTPSGVQSSTFTPSISAPPCPASTSGGWLVDGDVKLPSVGQTQATGTATAATTSGTASATGTAASASATGKKGGANTNGGKEVAGMAVGLAGVMVGFMYWL